MGLRAKSKSKEPFDFGFCERYSELKKLQMEMENSPILLKIYYYSFILSSFIENRVQEAGVSGQGMEYRKDSEAYLHP